MKQVFLLLCVLPALLFAQKDEDRLIQLSGLVLTSDSLIGIPYATIIIKHEGRGTLSNYDGFFSLVVLPGDSVKFSAVGFRPEIIAIPDTFSRKKYSVIQLLTQDTIYLPETIIYPWPTKEEFRKAFLSLNIPDDDLERARKNLERERLKEIGSVMAMDANEATDYYFRTEAQKFYYAGQMPPQNIFNPFAWAQFIEAWKRGDFRRK
ncbi:MAG: hypothetical protein KatS3mg031_2674 [Chitinophagales bacterium]|nr:MAG: hypothetical protein KatS3mg031_2674 [Chitinophagales bacterium]